MRILSICASAAMLACLVTSCAAADKTDDTSLGYQVIYKVPEKLIRESDDSTIPFLDWPDYAMDGRAVVFELPWGVINVMVEGKMRSFPLPAGLESLGRPSAAVVKNRLLYNTFDKQNTEFRLGSMDLTTGKCDTVSLSGWDDCPVTRFISPNGKLAADDSDGIRVLDLSTGKEVPLPKLTGQNHLLGWNKTSDGLYLVRSDGLKSTEVLLWKLAESEPAKVAVLQGDAEPGFASLSLSAGKLAWIHRQCLFVTDLTSGKTAEIARIDGYGTYPRMSPSGRFVLMDYSLPENRGDGYRIYDLSTGKAYTRVCTLDFPETMPCLWHPTQDKLLVAFAHSMTSVELREYTAAGLIEWITAKNASPAAGTASERSSDAKKK